LGNDLALVVRRGYRGNVSPIVGREEDKINVNRESLVDSFTFLIKSKHYKEILIDNATYST